MTELIPVRAVESIDPAKPTRLTPAQAGGPIHTRSFTGRFRNLRLLGAGLLFLLFFGTAWIDWNGRQAVLWDLDNRQFHIFGATFWPQDFILLSAILIIAAFGLFFITVLAGRVWCGYACPQSVWTWVFMRVEQITEGDRGQRIKLDAAPWSLQKLARRSAKHGLWLAVSVITAMAFVGYFTPVRQLTSDLLTLEMGATTAFWVLSFTAATYINAGWLREKVCRDMCPYSRFQSVMFDSDTLVISYDAARGENRGPRRKDADYKAEGLGDCIDCTMCVQVCPTGIDIRDGLQLECIGCGACVDACDSVMDKLGYARGLVRYSSENELAGGKTHWLRPRLIGYAAMLALMIGAFAWALAERPLISLDVTRDRGLFRENALGQIENIYSLKIINKTQQPRSYAISLVEPGDFELHGPSTLNLAPGEIRDLPVSVALTASHNAAGPQTLRFEVRDQADSQSHVSTKSTFLAPLR
ncbi:cytochrome c oxidase accessory protein CcoG [Pseudomonas oleovorans]|uniref:Cytochrome c oxidase accessory protein CcoG n=1 Tax=Ectopseudomonas oleovorans TaxID=301 RepID=A0AB35L6A3_ECTOL|nr:MULTISPECIES: cytochrome c oxidase accessory protein CcoG [Pseudomonas]MCR1829050.1 cytochrome c oxidase accessory protein CcoG [Pseudomonas oleovorans]MDH0569540.1 cytochrome c oxidase accessory protein CcoG [Pseudomonas oleovorans]MDH1280391.1 cytochrome c oxidase accessory protein CcoG [Pseudomonas chengduensis]TRO30103.1 cytochrome c oxidase accessory protein CcoG [Pseudomonas sp. ALS1279]